MAVKNVMTRDVIVAEPSMPIEEAKELLRRHKISGMPVVDQAGHVVGVFALSDLVCKTGRQVGEVMTTPPIVADINAGIGEVATLMAARRINRIPIVRDGVLVGIVTRGDVIAYVATRRAWAEETTVPRDRSV